MTNNVHTVQTGTYPISRPLPSNSDDLTPFTSIRDVEDYFYRLTSGSTDDTSRLTAAYHHLDSQRAIRTELLDEMLSLSREYLESTKDDGTRNVWNPSEFPKTITLTELYESQIVYLEAEKERTIERFPEIHT